MFVQSLPRLIANLSLVLAACSALELTPIRPARPPVGSLGRRDTSVLDLRDDENFLWGLDDSASNALANFTIYTPNADRHILSMERFDGMLTSVQCSPSHLVLQFVDDETFAYAQRVWDWVDGADNHTFLMVTGSGDCGPNSTARTPYSVSHIEYDEVTNVANLTATEGTFHSLATSYVMRVGDVGRGLPETEGTTNDNVANTRRDISREASIPLDAQFPFVFNVTQGPLLGALECDGCQTTGRMVFGVTVAQNVIGIPNGLSMSIRPSDVSATVGMKLTAAAPSPASELEKAASFKQTVLTIPLGGFSIPGGILDIGPVLDIDVGGSIAGLDGSLSVRSSGTGRLSDDAILTADLLKPANNKFSGWEPTLDFSPPTVEVKAAANAQVFLSSALRIKAEVLKRGVQTGLELQLPVLDLNFETRSKLDGGVCNKQDETGGIQVQASIGGSLKFTAGTTDGKIQPVDITIASHSFDLGSPICLVSVDGPVSVAPSPALTGITPASTPSPSSTPADSGGHTGSEAVKTCTANSGLQGSCISTSACSVEGGTSEAGHCPGGADIQCCIERAATRGGTVLTIAATNCTVDSERRGTCVAKAACLGGEGLPELGHCPGPMEIQCFVKPVTNGTTGEYTSSGTTCTVDNGRNGWCIASAACVGLGGVPEPGHCPGPKDTQCCVR